MEIRWIICVSYMGYSSCKSRISVLLFFLSFLSKHRRRRALAFPLLVHSIQASPDYRHLRSMTVVERSNFALAAITLDGPVPGPQSNHAVKFILVVLRV